MEKEKNNKNRITKKELDINKKMVLLIICAVIFVAIIVTAIVLNASKDKDIETIVLEKQYNDIYDWKYKIANEKIVKLQSKENKGDIKGETNVKTVKENFTFKALKEGKTTIKFTFVNTNNGSYMDIKEYNVIVDKDLKLTIKEKGEK